MAALELESGRALHPGDLGPFLDQQPDLGTKWSPRFVRVVDSLPKTVTNKITKTSLRAEGTSCADPLWLRPGKDNIFEPLVRRAEATETHAQAQGER